MIKIAMGSDHAGFKLKEYAKRYLVSRGYEVIDFGTNSDVPVDYPDFILPAAEAVSNERANYGVVFGGSGNGESIAANKVKGIRCALCWNVQSAELAKRHNNANIISIGARMVSESVAIEIIEIWLKADFEGGRHIERIKKIHVYEEKKGGIST